MYSIALSRHSSTVQRCTETRIKIYICVEVHTLYFSKSSALKYLGSNFYFHFSGYFTFILRMHIDIPGVIMIPENQVSIFSNCHNAC